MTIVGSTGGIGTAVIKTDYPVEEGLQGGTQKQEGRKINLVAEETSNIQEEQKKGLNS
jgi:hypothetical protein